MKKCLVWIVCLSLALSLTGCAEYEQLAQSIQDATQAVNEAQKETQADQAAQLTPSVTPEEAISSDAQSARSTAAPESTPQTQQTQSVPSEAPTPQATAQASGKTETIQKLTPLETVVAEFTELTKIPRGSHNEEKVSEYLYQWGLSHSLQSTKDESGNVILELPASTGCEDAPLIVLQAHMDMVVACEDGKTTDALQKGVTLINNGTTLSATGTSLGADDGIGVATALYILSAEEPVHGPVRAIFTVNEEDGMTDAENLSAQYLSDAAYLLNLDWKNEGSVNNACAGSTVYRFSTTPAWKAPEGNTAYEISLSGLIGGHSGLCIGEGRANAIKVLANLMEAAYKEGLMPEIAAFSGGCAKNAIPDQASLTLAIHDADAEAFENVVSDQAEAFDARYAKVETQASFTCTKLGTLPAQVLYAPISKAFCDLLYLCPDGVNTTSLDGSGAVESSSNIGLVTLNETELWFEAYTRSAKAEITREQQEHLQLLSALCGCTMRQMYASPAWAADENNKLVSLLQDAYRQLNGEEMRVESVHEDLECGYFMAKNPKLYCAAIGPAIENAHTVNETVKLDSIDANIKLIETLLKTISTQRA